MSGAVRITNVIGRRGRVLATRFQATLEGGPELAAALARLDDAVRVKASKDALLAAGGVLATEWRSRVPVLDANYQASLDAATTGGQDEGRRLGLGRAAEGRGTPRRRAAHPVCRPARVRRRRPSGRALGPPRLRCRPGAGRPGRRRRAREGRRGGRAMTLGDGLFAYLSATLSVGDRVYPLTLPQGAVLPAVVYQLVGGEGPLHSHSDAQDGDGTARARRTSAAGSSSAAGRTAPGRRRSSPPRSSGPSTASPGPGATCPSRPRSWTSRSTTTAPTSAATGGSSTSSSTGPEPRWP